MHKLTILCAAKTHCVTCRDRERGRTWRASLGAAFELPADAPDFACPLGLQWGYFNPVDVPDGYDAEVERLRLQQGGCCSGPSRSELGSGWIPNDQREIQRIDR
jgi:hypothetical protein